MQDGEAYRTGYEKGLKDVGNGKAAKPKPSFFKSIVSPDHFMKDYITGYRAGYASGLREDLTRVRAMARSQKQSSLEIERE